MSEAEHTIEPSSYLDVNTYIAATGPQSIWQLIEKSLKPWRYIWEITESKYLVKVHDREKKRTERVMYI